MTTQYGPEHEAVLNMISRAGVVFINDRHRRASVGGEAVRHDVVKALINDFGLLLHSPFKFKASKSVGQPYEVGPAGQAKLDGVEYAPVVKTPEPIVKKRSPLPESVPAVPSPIKTQHDNLPKAVVTKRVESAKGEEPTTQDVSVTSKSLADSIASIIGDDVVMQEELVKVSPADQLAHIVNIARVTLTGKIDNEAQKDILCEKLVEYYVKESVVQSVQHVKESAFLIYTTDPRVIDFASNPDITPDAIIMGMKRLDTAPSPLRILDLEGELEPDLARFDDDRFEEVQDILKRLVQKGKKAQYVTNNDLKHLADAATAALNVTKAIKDKLKRTEPLLNECKNCGKQLEEDQEFFCCDECKAAFKYSSDLRDRALAENPESLPPFPPPSGLMTLALDFADGPIGPGSEPEEDETVKPEMTECDACYAGVSSRDEENIMFECGSIYNIASGDQVAPCDGDDDDSEE